MHFARPDMLLWLLGLPLLAAVLAGYWAWKRALVRRLGHVPTIRAMTERHAPRLQLAQQVLVLCAIALLIIAAARPQWGQTNRLVKRTGIDVVFALDLSQSMLARDVIPSRLDAAKREISATLERLKGDRAGLVVFTSVSFPQSPLTSDYGAIRFYLRKLQPDQMSFGGTSLGRAIHDGVELLTGERVASEASADAPRADTSPHKIKRARTQLIVLITDGEDHESDLSAAAKLARDRNIHIVTVGFGSSAGERIPVIRQDGTIIGYKRDRKGQIVYTKLDEAALQRIASDTGGLALRYGGEGSVANQLVAYINQLERSEMETLLRRRYKDHFTVFLIPALLCLLAALALGDRRRLPERPKRAPKRNALIKAGVVLLALITLSGCEQMFTREIEPVARGNQLLSEGKHDEALKAYEEALVELPADARLTYNTGVAQLGLDDHDRAQETLASALASDDPELRLRARYNLGISLMRQEKWAEAHATFKQALADAATHDALRDHPARRDAAHNMELAFRKLYPPCAELEDEHEDNDARTTATRLSQLQLKDLALCGLDDDWFAVPVLPGTRLEVRATFRNLRAKPDPEHVFLPAPEDLTLTLFDSTGTRTLVEARGEPEAPAKGDDKKGDDKKGGDDKKDDKKPEQATRLIASTLITPELLGAADGKADKAAGAVLLRVRAAEHLEFKYDVSITAIPPCSAIDDKHEPNNARAQAKVLEPGEHKLHLCKGDEDWFIVNAQLGDTFFVDVQPMQDPAQEKPAQTTLEIRDARTGKLVTRGADESGVVTAGVWEVMRPGAYAVRITGADAEQQGPYTLQLHSFAPCPAGDDRFEDNDVADRAALLDPQAPMHRYLRICPQDRDFYRLALKPPQPPNAPNAGKKGDATSGGKDANTDKKPETHKLAYGLSIVRRPGEDPATSEAVDAGGDDSALPLGFDLMSASGDQIVLQSVPAAALDNKKARRPGKGKRPDSAPSVRIDRILQHDGLEQPEALLRVQGPALFYHLVQLNPQSQQNQDQQDKDKDKKDQEQDKSEDKKQGDQGKEDQRKRDEQGEPKSPEDKQKEDQQQQGKNGKDPDRPEEQRGKDASPDQARDGNPNAPERDDPKAQRAEDVLRALEQTDDNFQMRKALQHIPRQRYYIEKDW